MSFPRVTVSVKKNKYITKTEIRTRTAEDIKVKTGR